MPDNPAAPTRPLPRATTDILTRRQRLAIARARLRRWEFWPAAVFYLPIVAWIVLLGLYFRRPTAFTAANPGMDDGGVVGERKFPLLSQLLERLPDAAPASGLLAAERSTDARLETAREFAARHGYPLVLKPNVGQRGRGVAIVRADEQLRDYLVKSNFDVVIQAYAGGGEFGVFMARIPGTGNFEIISLTEKALPQVSGDGQRTLAKLILDDPRGWLNAPLLFERHAARLHGIPADGDVIPLVELGSHCRGATFLNGMDLASPALLGRMQAIARALPDFHFGRFDIRAPDREALRRGEGLKVIEINGVTAECAHVYHPGTPLLTGYKVFFAQWLRAFRLGAENIRAGASTVGPIKLLRLWLADLRRYDDAEYAAGR